MTGLAAQSCVFTMTPYHVWRRSHAYHHATSGNLTRRGVGDIKTLTIAEYHKLPALQRLRYRLYRHPLVMFGLGPAYIFMIDHRLPLGYLRDGWKPWISTMGTNLSIACVVAAMMYIVGWKEFLLVQIPVTLVAASVGVWLFYVQHQFEDTFWEEDAKWKLQDAALYGSSHYELPAILRWFSANIWHSPYPSPGKQGSILSASKGNGREPRTGEHPPNDALGKLFRISPQTLGRAPETSGFVPRSA